MSRRTPAARTQSGQVFAPARLLQERAEETFDTPENRFLRHFVTLLRGAALALEPLLVRMGLQLDRLDGLRRVRRELEQVLGEPWLAEVGPLHYVPHASRVLQRRHGYKELHALYPVFLFARTPLAGALAEAVPKCGHAL